MGNNGDYNYTYMNGTFVGYGYSYTNSDKDTVLAINQCGNCTVTFQGETSSLTPNPGDSNNPLYQPTYTNPSDGTPNTGSTYDSSYTTYSNELTIWNTKDTSGDVSGVPDDANSFMIGMGLIQYNGVGALFIGPYDNSPTGGSPGSISLTTPPTLRYINPLLSQSTNPDPQGYVYPYEFSLSVTTTTDTTLQNTIADPSFMSIFSPDNYNIFSSDSSYNFGGIAEDGLNLMNIVSTNINAKLYTKVLSPSPYKIPKTVIIGFVYFPQDLMYKEYEYIQIHNTITSNNATTFSTATTNNAYHLINDPNNLTPINSSKFYNQVQTVQTEYPSSSATTTISTIDTTLSNNSVPPPSHYTNANTIQNTVQGYYYNYSCLGYSSAGSNTYITPNIFSIHPISGYISLESYLKTGSELALGSYTVWIQIQKYNSSGGIVGSAINTSFLFSLTQPGS